MTDYHYRADAPYPVPEKLPINPRWARVLMSDYSGKSSELTAITQYIYHHMEFDALDAGIAKCLRSIAMVEMKHLELLGECIRRLGAAPRFFSEAGERKRYWNASLINYGRRPKEMLELDLRAERQAIQNYEKTILRISDLGIKKLIRRIILDEKLHVGILEDVIFNIK